MHVIQLFLITFTWKEDFRRQACMLALTSVVPYCFLIACLHQVLSLPQCQHLQVLQLHQGKILPYRGRVKMPSVLDFVHTTSLAMVQFQVRYDRRIKEVKTQFLQAQPPSSQIPTRRRSVYYAVYCVQSNFNTYLPEFLNIFLYVEANPV